MPILSLIVVLGLAAVHIFAGKLEFLKGKPRHVWLSVAGGLSVAFVFVFLLPELASRQEQIQPSAVGAGLDFLAHHVYILALAGMIAFYGLERFAKTMRQHVHTKSGPHRDKHIFWAHITSFAIYNVVIGYMLSDETRSLPDLVLFFVAMALHFLVMDFSFREHYQQVHHRIGRWVLAGAVVMGWVTGIFVELSDLVMSVAIAFVAGGIILNALKEELPEERQSRFWPFLLGATLYTAVAIAHANWSQA